MIHIYAPPSVGRTLKWLECHDCKKVSPIAFLHYEIHGPSMTCMRCGRQYNEDGKVRAPLARGWRKESKDMMRRYWKSARPLSEWIDAMKAAEQPMPGGGQP